MQDEYGSGRVIKAPENFLSRGDVATVWAESKRGRRDFLRNAFAAAAAGAAAGGAGAQAASGQAADDNIVDAEVKEVKKG